MRFRQVIAVAGSALVCAIAVAIGWREFHPFVKEGLDINGATPAARAEQSYTPLTAEQEQGLKPKDTFRECADCPEMVVVPAGSFSMGSSDYDLQRQWNEGPQHVVKIGEPFAVGKFHVTVDQFGAFVRETGYEASKKMCHRISGIEGSWRDPGLFAQKGSDPVVCVSWDDANAYAKWLAKTGKSYRLLSEAEFEYAARGRTSPGTGPRFWWGNSPVERYEPNAFGLFNMAGTAWQWTADCYHSFYYRASADSSAWTGENRDCDHVVRGGSRYDTPGDWRAAARAGVGKEAELGIIGFRIARTLTP